MLWAAVKPNASQWDATLRDDVGFATVYRRIYRRKFLTLSNQTSRYIRECIRMSHIWLQKKILSMTELGFECQLENKDMFWKQNGFLKHTGDMQENVLSISRTWVWLVWSKISHLSEAKNIVGSQNRFLLQEWSSLSKIFRCAGLFSVHYRTRFWMVSSKMKYISQAKTVFQNMQEAVYLHYENMPIQIYWKFYYQILKIFR